MVAIEGKRFATPKADQNGQTFIQHSGTIVIIERTVKRSNFAKHIAAKAYTQG
jgi:hypothetical protein